LAVSKILLVCGEERSSASPSVVRQSQLLSLVCLMNSCRYGPSWRKESPILSLVHLETSHSHGQDDARVREGYFIVISTPTIKSVSALLVPPTTPLWAQFWPNHLQRQRSRYSASFCFSLVPDDHAAKIRWIESSLSTETSFWSPPDE
jgi:hypothetical protein